MSQDTMLQALYKDSNYLTLGLSAVTQAAGYKLSFVAHDQDESIVLASKHGRCFLRAVDSKDFAVLQARVEVVALAEPKMTPSTWKVLLDLHDHKVPDTSEAQALASLGVLSRQGHYPGGWRIECLGWDLWGLAPLGMIPTVLPEATRLAAAVKILAGEGVS